MHRHETYEIGMYRELLLFLLLVPLPQILCISVYIYIVHGQQLELHDVCALLGFDL